MRRLLGFAAAAAGLLFFCLPTVRTDAAPAPSVTNVVEGRDADTGRIALTVVGAGVSKFKRFALHTTSGADVGTVDLTFKSSTMIGLRLPDATTTGDYDLVLGFGKSGEQTHRISITAGVIAPGSITAGALAPTFLADLNDADTLSGHLASDFALAGQTLPRSGSASISGSLTVSASGPGNVVAADTPASGGVGVLGHATNLIDASTGVEGVSESLLGVGVLGNATATTGATFGVRGTSASASGVGVGGIATQITGTTFGVYGSAGSTSGVGVGGYATATSGSADGVYGETSSGTGDGVHGVANATSGGATGVLGSAASSTGIGVHGDVPAASGSTTGVYGSAASTSGVGVYGADSSATGFTFGVYGTVPSPDGIAVEGQATSSTGTATGVFGKTLSATGFAVFGTATSTSGANYGVYGTTASSSGTAVYGYATASSGSGFGVVGNSSTASGVGVAAVCAGASSTGLTVDHNGTNGNLAVLRSGGSNVARVDKTGKGYFNGGTQTGGADFAESVGVRAAGRAVEAGDVVAIDRTGRRRFVLCDEAESPLVAGICSTKPGVLACPRDVAGAGGDVAGEIPLAITGIVPCKVCDEGGAIQAGDLLVAASIPGYAKKAPASPKPGTLVAKALEPMKDASGRIEALITMR